MLRHYLMGSVLINITTGKKTYVIKLVHPHSGPIRVQGSKLREGVTFGPQRGDRGVQAETRGTNRLGDREKSRNP